MRTSISSIILLAFCALSVISCDKISSEDITSSNETSWEKDPNLYYLSDISADSCPTQTDTLVFYDVTATTADFAGLNAALRFISAYTSRELHLSFPLLEKFPEFAIFGESAYDYYFTPTSFTSLSAAVATEVGQCAFYSCESLHTVDLPNVTTIHDAAFNWCTAVTNFNLPRLTKLGYNAISYCTSLTELSLPRLTYVNNRGIFFNSALTSLETPLVNEIEDFAYAKNSVMTTLSLPKVTEVPKWTFTSCSKLAYLELPKATTFENYCFESCSSLVTLKIASENNAKLKSIGEYAFDGVTTTKIALTLSISNAEYVDGNTLTIGENSWTFLSITLEGETITVS
ncbi:MAG: leucine-rich repeat domain-containing protein [Rikenellaceae bacterium]